MVIKSLFLDQRGLHQHQFMKQNVCDELPSVDRLFAGFTRLCFCSYECSKAPDMRSASVSCIWSTDLEDDNGDGTARVMVTMAEERGGGGGFGNCSDGNVKVMRVTLV